jgi:GT2 family glycosyltransferase
MTAQLGFPAIQRQDRPVTLATGAGKRVVVDGKFFARGGRRLLIQGVTYGPFAPNAEDSPFPTEEQVRADFSRMLRAGINAIRTYHVPPEWLLALADQQGIVVLMDVPWPKHVCFLQISRARRQAHSIIRLAARIGRRHPCILGYGIANEIPPDVIRWHGAGRVERFLTELRDAVKETDPEGLVTYASYPSTEYLDLSTFDFLTFNVYLHRPKTFRRYLFRLQNLAQAKPLVLGEFGMDTLRYGEERQARFLASQLREAALLGLAGTFVFSWTDEWHTGGHAIVNWGFGITRADRSPKPAFYALGQLLRRSPTELAVETPRVSVILCTYNGSRTLEQCLRSLAHLDYPDYEVIVVDDGSTDSTQSILSRHSWVRAIRQSNQGLSAARNVGLRAATGTIIAYTDSDCYVDQHWLTLLVHRLQQSKAAGVGGPNLTPDDGRLAACVAACPGQPVHVLESDQVAEHIPGCNMAFRREALEAINGFDPQFRRAGDDVDLCWRLQQAGLWITFAPGAVVWHHRRQGPRAYLRQQAGYGEAEALLWFKHPDKFNRCGNGKWRGVLYGASAQGLRLGGPIIYRGTYGTGLFQCLYQPAPAHWAMLPATLEWHALTLAVGLAAYVWPMAWMAVAIMWGTSLGIAAIQALQARLAPEYDGPISRLLVTALCYVQPLVRSWARYRTRLFGYRTAAAEVCMPFAQSTPFRFAGSDTRAYWSDGAGDRLELLGRVTAYQSQYRWGQVVDAGWSDWDLEVYCHPHPWTVVRICTAQEEHGSGRRLIRVRFTLRMTTYSRVLIWAGLLAAASAWYLGVPALIASIAAFVTCALMRRRGALQAAHVVGVFDLLAKELGWITLVEAKNSRRTLRVPSVLRRVIPERLFRHRRCRITRSRD